METRQLRYSVLFFSHHYGAILVHISSLADIRAYLHIEMSPEKLGVVWMTGLIVKRNYALMPGRRRYILGISNGISETSQNFASLILFEPRVSALEFSTGRLETVARHERRRHAETIHPQRNKLMQHRSRLKIIQIRSHKEVNE